MIKRITPFFLIRKLYNKEYKQVTFLEYFSLSLLVKKDGKWKKKNLWLVQGYIS